MSVVIPSATQEKDKELEASVLADGVRGNLDGLFEPVYKPLVQGPHLTSELVKQCADIEINQGVETMDELRTIASRVMNSHNRLTEEVAEASQGRPTYAKDLKGVDSIGRKYAEHGHTFNRIGDVVRTSIIFDDLESLYDAVIELYERAEIVRVKDRFVNVRKSGYRDLLFNIRMEDPETGKDHVTEIQFQLNAMHDAKGKETPKYEKRRTLKKELKECLEEQPDNIVKIEGLGDEIKDLERESKKIFDEAWTPYEGSFSDYWEYQRAA